MFYRIMGVFLLILSFQACSIKYKSPKISDLIFLEDKLIEPYYLNKLKNDKVNKILKSALYELKLPSDFAFFELIETGVPTLYTGISSEIYITKSFLNVLNKGLISENECKLIIIHELLHKKLRHPNKALSSPELTISELSMKNLIKASLQVSTILYLKNKGGVTGLQYFAAYSAVDQVVDKFSSKNDQQKYRKLLSMPFVGYNYSEEEEFIVDKMVEDIVRKNNGNIEEYKETLVVLKRLLETTSKIKISNQDLDKLNIRIKKLNKERK